MTEDQAGRAANILRAIANPMRVRMVQGMAKREIKVGDLANIIGLSPSATSQHLLIFKAAGLLAQRRDKQSQHCRIAPSMSKTLQQLIAVGEEHAPLIDPKRKRSRGRPAG
ncbi:ArsR/SmtB family transcription factor [Rhizobium sp. Leaf341]|uniref:ArsR/SmtB family transcription factor n=1 Tax=Rhizobium sp. Leaf341 TaxID=1736344 RepID=UPI0009E8EADD